MHGQSGRCRRARGVHTADHRDSGGRRREVDRLAGLHDRELGTAGLGGVVIVVALRGVGVNGVARAAAAAGAVRLGVLTRSAAATVLAAAPADTTGFGCAATCATTGIRRTATIRAVSAVAGVEGGATERHAVM